MIKICLRPGGFGSAFLLFGELLFFLEFWEKSCNFSACFGVYKYRNRNPGPFQQDSRGKTILFA
jgi:hypothetical protein